MAQVIGYECPDGSPNPSGGVPCVQFPNETNTCYNQVEVTGFYGCSPDASSTDGELGYCPYSQPAGQYSAGTCCDMENGVVCNSGGLYCISQGQVCCGYEAYCDVGQECINETCCKNSCGNTCLDNTQNVCCGGTTVCSSQSCINNSCCTNVCGSQCLDGSDSTCCGDTAVCSAGQQCMENTCTSIPPSQTLTTSPVNSPAQASTPSTIPSQAASPLTSIARPPTTLTNQVSTPSSNPLSELNADVPTSVRTDPAAACFLSTQFTCYYTTPTWYKLLPSNAQSLYSATNAAASHGAFCTSTAVINPQCLNGTHKSGLSPSAKVGVGLGSAAGVLAIAALILYLLKACLPASSKVPLAFKPFLPPPPPPASIPPGTPGGPQAPQPYSHPPANPAQPNVPHYPSYPPHLGPPNTPGMPTSTNPMSPITSIPPALDPFTSTPGTTFSPNAPSTGPNTSSGTPGTISSPGTTISPGGWNGVSGPNPGNWTGVSGPGAQPPAPPSHGHHSVPLPLIIGGLRRRDDRNNRNQANTILRKAIPSQQLPDRSDQGINEAGGGPISEMSEDGTRSATISSVEDIASGSWGLSAQEMQGSEIHEVAEGVNRHEVPEGVRRYEVPEGTRRHEAPDQQVYEAPGHGSN